MWNLSSWIMCGVMLVLAGCAHTPSTNIHQPMTARASDKKAGADNGAIFQAGQNERPLYEGKRARNVGDILTIIISETTSATGKSSSGAEHKGSISMQTPVITQIPGADLMMHGIGVAGSSNGSLANKSNNAGDNTFAGTVTVTVVEALTNGNLLVSGEKQVAINQANEYIRFSGVVNPYTITGSNTVLSTQVADAHIEYKGANHIDMSVVMSMLGRVFLSVLPF
ncbi:flagellar basal body L-ring protein FlgH [Candidatus Nitrotoga sp. 1052]|uniref:flagellar basal body L-ring protein FlgH n=1 Tax=Candidatus Nitrotoga sp. 1052 TaxID=2886964 RepID=UPI001EF63152|nr:flagellar basal body L-ring protein FlgH [Candidatus Nitrotoga sp. 1052]CAH1073876.1 flagellar L-ring protein [Candidatus Nitrotoga sp. 1052]